MNKLVDEYNNTHHHSIVKEPTYADFSALFGEVESRPLNLKLVVESRLLNIRIFVIDSMLKTNPWPSKIKDLKRDAIIGSFYQKVLLLSRLWRSYYLEPVSHIKNRFKLVLGLSNYPTEKKKNTTGFDISNLLLKVALLTWKLRLTK